MGKHIYQIILRKVNTGMFSGLPILVYRANKDDNGNIEKYLTSYDGSHSEMCYDFYHRNTVKATKKECQSLLDSLFDHKTSYAIYKRLKFY